jgi:hypothetical protein
VGGKHECVSHPERSKALPPLCRQEFLRGNKGADAVGMKFQGVFLEKKAREQIGTYVCFALNMMNAEINP